MLAGVLYDPAIWVLACRMPLLTRMVAVLDPSRITWRSAWVVEYCPPALARFAIR